MRTTTTTTTTTAAQVQINSGKSNKLASLKSGAAAPASKRSSNDDATSFDQLLQKRRSPKQDEPKSSEAAAPTRSDRPKKSRAVANKPRTKQAAEEADVEPMIASCANQTASTEGQTNAASASDESDESEQPIVTAIGENEPKEADAEDRPPAEQIIDAPLIVGIPSDAPIDVPAATDEVGLDAQPVVQPVDATVMDRTVESPLGHASGEARPAVTEPVSTDDPEAVVEPITLELAAGDESPVVLEGERAVRDVAERPQASNAPRGSAPASAPAAASIEVEPIAPSKLDEADDGAAQHDSKSHNASAIPDFGGEPVAEGSAGDLSFEPAGPSASSKHIETPDVKSDATTTTTTTTTISLTKPEVAPPPQLHSTSAPAQPAPAPERVFAADNHAGIVQNVRTNLLPNGGTMQITLNPPELGAIQVAVHMRDGVMNASFETTSDQATRLLSHSLGELRASLENSGVAVDKLHVEQSPKGQQSQSHMNDDRQQQSQSNDSSARREQERRELLQRMWRRLAEGSDPLDMVA